MSDTDRNDPDDSPLTRHVLYTNDVHRVLGACVGALLSVARPERVREALKRLLDNFDAHVLFYRAVSEEVAAEKGVPSGWEDPK